MLKFEFFTVTETQIDSNGNVSSTPYVFTGFDTETGKYDAKAALRNAKSKYHAILSAIDISTIPYHSASLVDSNGVTKYAEFKDERVEEGEVVEDVTQPDNE